MNSGQTFHQRSRLEGLALTAAIILLPYVQSQTRKFTSSALAETVGLFLVLAVLVLWLLHRWPDQRIEVVRDFWRSRRAWLGAFFAGLVAVTVLTRASNLLQHLLEVNRSAAWENASDPLIQHGWARWMLFAFFTTVPAVIEEVVFKSVLLGWVFPRANLWAYSILSGALFGMAHMSHGPAMMLVTFALVGVPTAAYFHRTRNLGAVIAFHTTVSMVGFAWAFLR